MRIGIFAKKNATTIDTVRFYIELGLLLPDKENKQFHFDAQCQADFKSIIQLKNMGFSLLDIKNVFYFKRLGQNTGLRQHTYTQSLMEQKLFSLNEAKMQLENQIHLLEDTLSIHASHISSSMQLNTAGIPLHVLAHLYCPHCNSPFVLKQGDVVNNKIYSGLLSCTCTKTYRIDQGIIIDTDLDNRDEKWTYDEAFIERYIANTDSKFLDNLTNSIEWFQRRIDFSEFNAPLILELGSGIGFFLRNMLESIPTNSIYVAVDHDLNRHRFLQQCLSLTSPTHTVVLICTDFHQIPLKKQSVDILCDITGSTNYHFEHADLLLGHIKPLLKKSHLLIGSYLLFNNFSLNSQIPLQLQKYFTLDGLKKNLSAFSYHIEEYHLGNTVQNGGLYEDFFIDAESIFSFLLLAKPLG